MYCFEHLEIRISNLFRVSCFGFRIYLLTCQLSALFLHAPCSMPHALSDKVAHLKDGQKYSQNHISHEKCQKQDHHRSQK